MVDASAPLKCFVSYDTHNEPTVTELKFLLRELGVDCFDTADVKPGQNIGGVIFASLKAADFIAVLIDSNSPSSSNYATFEAGVAVGLGKPLLLVSPRDAFLSNLGSNIPFTWIKTDRLSSSKSDLSRFLRHIRQKLPLTLGTPLSGLDAANIRNQLIDLRSLNSVDRGQKLEGLVANLFRQLDSEVSLEDEAVVNSDDPTYQRDMIVWSDPLVAQFGGPMIIECKYYGGGSGSIIVNARNTLAKLSKYIENSSAAIGILVYDHDRSNNVSIGPGETAKAVAISIDDLVEAFAQGTVGNELWRRRARAASQRGIYGDAS